MSKELKCHKCGRNIVSINNVNVINGNFGFMSVSCSNCCTEFNDSLKTEVINKLGLTPEVHNTYEAALTYSNSTHRKERVSKVIELTEDPNDLENVIQMYLDMGYKVENFRDYQIGDHKYASIVFAYDHDLIQRRKDAEEKERSKRLLGEATALMCAMAT